MRAEGLREISFEAIAVCNVVFVDRDRWQVTHRSPGADWPSDLNIPADAYVISKATMLLRRCCSTSTRVIGRFTASFRRATTASPRPPSIQWSAMTKMRCVSRAARVNVKTRSVKGVRYRRAVTDWTPFESTSRCVIEGGCYRFAAACHAAAARRIRFGCNTPSWGDCPNGAAGGTSNHGVLYGSSTAFARLNFVG